MNTPERIQLSRAKGWRKPQDVVNVARPTRWGNPFTVDQYYDAGYSGSLEVAQKHCVDAYRALLEGRHHWAHAQPQKHPAPDLAPLRGKSLACWCKAGTPCHADVLIELANRDVKLSVRPSEWRTLSPEAQAKLTSIMKSPEALAKMRADRIAEGNAREAMANKILF